MFTGLVTDMAEVIQCDGKRLLLIPNKMPKVLLGQSIAVSGCCLTLVHLEKSILSFDLNSETLEKTYFKDVKPGQRLNIEYPLVAGSALDGHIVTGHIDTTGTLLKIKAHNESTSWTVACDPEFSKWVVPKGSVAVEGVSLTINNVSTQGHFEVCLIPHTYAHTNMQFKNVHDPLHIEFDMMAKFFEKQCKPYLNQIEQSI